MLGVVAPGARVHRPIPRAPLHPHQVKGASGVGQCCRGLQCGLQSGLQKGAPGAASVTSMDGWLVPSLPEALPGCRFRVQPGGHSPGRRLPSQGVVCGFKFGASRAQGLPQSRSCLPPSSAKHPRVGCTMDCTLVVKNRAAIHVSLVGSFHLLLPQRAVSPRRHLPQQWAPTSACPPTPPAPARLCHRVPSVCPHHHQRPPPGPPQPRRVSTTVARKPAKGPPGWTTNRAPAAACNGTTFKIPQRLTELQTGTQRDSICLWPQTLLASTPDTPQTLCLPRSYPLTLPALNVPPSNIIPRGSSSLSLVRHVHSRIRQWTIRCPDAPAPNSRRAVLD